MASNGNNGFYFLFYQNIINGFTAFHNINFLIAEFICKFFYLCYFTIRVAAKHGGTMTCQVQDNIFYLDVVLFDLNGAA